MTTSMIDDLYSKRIHTTLRSIPSPRQDFFSCSSMPRNRELMRVFKDVGLVEQLGSGMSRILKVYDKSIFHISEHFIKVEFPFSMPKDVRNIASGDKNGDIIGDKNGDITGENADSNIVLEFLRDNPTITAALLAEKGIGKSYRNKPSKVTARIYFSFKVGGFLCTHSTTW